MKLQLNFLVTLLVYILYSILYVHGKASVDIDRARINSKTARKLLSTHNELLKTNIKNKQQWNWGKRHAKIIKKRVTKVATTVKKTITKAATTVKNHVTKAVTAVKDKLDTRIQPANPNRRNYSDEENQRERQRKMPRPRHPRPPFLL